MAMGAMGDDSAMVTMGVIVAIAAMGGDSGHGR